MMYAQQDASTVYASFARNSSILKTTSPHSAEYEAAKQEMLQLYPQLQYHAAKYSQNRQTANAMTFAKAYVDMAMMPQFEDMHLEKSEQYPTMTYFLASNYYNRKDYTNAATYLQRYIDLNVEKNRTMVYLFLAKSHELLQDTQAELNVLEKALEEYPTNKDLLSMSINVRMEKGWYSEALPYIDRALAVNRGDSKIMSLKGQCYEALQRYEEAVDIYAFLAEQKKTLAMYKHYAINLFNCGVQYSSTNRSLATSYMQRSIPVLKQVVANDPTSIPFTNALAMAYLYTDQYDLLAETNDRLRALGANEVEAGSATEPVMLASDLKRPAKSANTQPVAKPQNTTSPQTGFKAFAQTFIEKEIQLWQQKDPFETIDEYKSRVTEQTRAMKVEELMEEAKKQYIAKQEKKIRISDFILQPYDAENRVFLIQSKYGDIVLPVPRENNEARNFANTWKEVHIEHPEFDIAGDQMVIRSADFVTRNGIVYHYSDQDEMKYSQAQIAMQFDEIDYSKLGGSAGQRNKVKVEKNTVTVGSSDVDINIPVNKVTHNDKFAFLIGNENYQLIASVPYALHDVRTMKQYCNKALGIPETNIRVYEDATFGKMLACVRDIKAISDAYNGEIDIIFYYAGHGVPDEASKSAYLLPIDADGIQKESCYPVGRLYNVLGGLGARSVIVMMDACFSGSQRGEGMLASARGVALKAKPDAPQGRMVAISAATGEETAYPYEEQQHGMFTYYLLKAIQESKGKLTLGELADYVQTQVRQRSVVINHKSQTPTVNASSEAKDWQNWKLK
jgi:tetratricopeptide (TPR) repeat protein